ncbi:hypothetical protein [Parahaliea aestuarii]|uniref:Uncharacterized protein n=1 Tax=Parahaliea aestuarii TaxID=1852021 RepID=A0A5C9A5M8_9GAMM|nr:hypothetical protein [Parahaliea aestuarii]TXS94471.1 hypothetical protein FVW59_00695 [Parahaliea aestuarii]
MHKRTKLWSSLSLAALVGGTSLAVAAADELQAAAAMDTAAADTGQAAAAGGEGEGEGLAQNVDPATNDVAYLSQLGLMRGHLLVGLELYRAGHIEHARMHMKHPKSELYADMEPAFKARGSAGFADQLTALANAVESDDSSAEEVEAAYAAVLEGISASEARVGSLSPATRLGVVVKLVRTAADEYALGVVDGKVVNGHEYQDAYGFTRTAQSLVANMDVGDDADLAATRDGVKALIQGLFDANLWLGIMPPEAVDGNASQLYGAAARIEIAALSL